MFAGDGRVDSTKISSIFDWNIVTPKSTVQFLEYCKSGDEIKVLTDRSNYISEAGYLKNIEFEGFYFRHDNATKILSGDIREFDFFAGKLTYKVKNFLAINPIASRVYFWSNLQPNLKRSTQVLNLNWDNFRLTRSTYCEIKDSLEATFPGNASTVFTTRSDDTDFLLGEVHDLNFFSIERGADYRGENGLFRGVIESTLKSSKNI